MTKPTGRCCSSARCARRLAVRARIGTALTVEEGKPRSSITAAIGMETFIVSRLPQASATASPSARASATCGPLTPCSSASSRIRSARGSTGLWTGWPKPGALPPELRIRRASSPATWSGLPPAATPARASSSNRAHASDVPRMTGPAPRIPAATAPWRDPGSAASVIRAVTLVGIIPCSAIATSRRSRKKRWSSVGSAPVRSRWKYSVKVSLPIRSPVRSRPRTSTLSGYARLMWLAGSERKVFSNQARPGDHRFELAERPLARQVLHPAVGRDDEPLRRHHLERSPDPLCDDVRRLDLGRAEVEDSQDDRLVGEVAKHLRVEIRLCRLERDV